MRVHTLIFTIATLFLLAVALVGITVRASAAWPIIFAIGAATAGTYMVIGFLALSERIRNLLLHATIQKRVLTVATVFVPTLSGLSIWIAQAGTVEALPIFPVFIAIFYGWILLQAYFIVAPVSHALEKIEGRLNVQGKRRNLVQGLATGTLLLPIIPLVYGVWLVSSWASSAYQNVPGATGKILFWAISVIFTLLLTFFLLVRWGWRAMRQGRPQSAIFAGATFAILWVYLLYRASALLIAYVNQSQPSNALIDVGLMGLSVFGAMQTFAKKAVGRASGRWSQVFPFLIFSFASVYAVAQLYFVVQFTITRVELSALVNVIVLGSGILTMLLIIRGHLRGFSSLPSTIPVGETTPTVRTDNNKTSAKSPISWVMNRLRPRTADEEKSQDDY